MAATWSYACVITGSICLPIAATILFHPLRPMLVEPPLAENEIKLEEIIAKKIEPLWIDAREESAFLAGHIPNAIPLNQTNWDQQISQVIERWDPAVLIVVYCDQRACGESRMVALKLEKQYQITPVRVLHQGWVAWKTRPQ